MRRIVLVLALTAVMVAVAVLGSGGALAAKTPKMAPKTTACVKADLAPAFCVGG